VRDLALLGELERLPSEVVVGGGELPLGLQPLHPLLDLQSGLFGARPDACLHLVHQSHLGSFLELAPQ
jgi:hypothetical protein